MWQENERKLSYAVTLPPRRVTPCNCLGGMDQTFICPYLFTRGEVVHLLAVLDVLDPDLDLLEGVEDVSLGEGDGRVAVDERREAEQRDVQPAATPLPSRRDPDLVAHALQELANIL